ncbi:MAG TPA: FG-GAP-like repeat-containing protein [Blastocatellia bacterium]|nr:FG-GAP-like repeat-containing protein [Blastocatellia bacterium]
MKLSSVRLHLSVAFILVSACIGGWLLSSHPTALPDGSAATAPRVSAAVSSVAAGTGSSRDCDPATRSRISQAYGRLPLRFEANAGQTDEAVKFLVRGSGYTFFLTAEEAVIRLRRTETGTPQPDQAGKLAACNVPSNASESMVRMKLLGADSSSRLTGMNPLGGRSSYFIGNDPGRWRTGVVSFEKVRQENVWPGVDLVWYGNQQQLEYDFVVAPGTDPRAIRLAISGTQAMKVDAEGRLVLPTENGDLLMQKPQAWQEVAGERKAIACQYRLGASDEVAFDLGSYDSTLPLVIDPVLVYSTLLGGTGSDQALSVAVDSDGNAYVTGQTNSTDFPGGSAIQAAKGSQNDVFVMKLNPAGNAVVYATWLGGSGNESGTSIAVDAGGSAFVAGVTTSLNFPLLNPLQPAWGGSNDAFLVKLNPAGSALVWSTYLGGSGTDSARALALDGSGNAYLTGDTDSWDFPLRNAMQTSKKGSAVYTSSDSGSNWNAAGNELKVSQVYDLALDPKNPATLYAGTERGIYKSTNSGGVWARIGGTQLPYSVTQLAIDYVTTSTLYAVSGAFLYKSTDSGGTWTKLNIPSIVQSLTMDPVSPATLYITDFNSAYKSTDGGTTWTPVNNPRSVFGGAVDINSIAIDSTTPTILYAGTTNGIYKSTDGGKLWTPLTSGLPTGYQLNISRMVISRSNPSVLYAVLNTGGIYKTTNGGNNWESVTPPLPSYTSLTVLVIDPTSANTVYLGTQLFGLYKTTDGGATWQAGNNGLNAQYVAAIAIPVSAPATVYAGTSSGTDAFVSKINANGSALIYSSYLGGSNNDGAYDIAVDAGGNAYLTGGTASFDFPTANAYQATLNGSSDAFVTGINPAGSGLLWSTFLGGSQSESGFAIAVGATGSVYVTGDTGSTDFPTVNPLQANNRSVSPAINDGFVTRFSADGAKLDYSTYLGGRDFDYPTDLALDAAGNVYVTGQTFSSDFPTFNALQPFNGSGSTYPSHDAFVTKLKADGSAFVYSTWLGGGDYDQAYSIAVDAAGNAYVTGFTFSLNFPLTPNPLRSTRVATEAFITKLAVNSDLSVSLSDQPDPVMVGNTLTYTLTVTNNGPDIATGVTVTDTLPAGATFVSATASQGSCSGSGPVTCGLGEMPAGGKVTISIVVTPNATATISSTASVTSTIPDLNAANNSATQQTKVSNLPSIYGRVITGDGAGLSAVSMALSGAQVPSVTTASDGSYQIGELTAGGSYIITPSRQGYVFNPPSRSFGNLSADQRADFGAVACLFSIAPLNQSFPATGGTGTVKITSPDPQCPWNARSNVPWITLNAPVSGTGSATLTFSVAPTVGSRSGTLTIAGNTFTVWQEFNACSAPNFSGLPLVPMGPVITSTGAPNLVVKDFNGDGQPDVAWTGTSNSLPAVSVSLSNGSGGYNAPASLLTAPEYPAFTSIRAADFNNDGRPDLAVIRDTRLYLLLNDGAGTFKPPVETNLSQRLASLLTGDFNGDGNTDLVFFTVDVPSDIRILVLSGTGTGSFGAVRAIAYRPVVPVSQSDSGDFNGDGKADLALLYGPGLIIILKGTGTGDFEFATSIDATGGTVGIMTVGDFNGDLRSDVAYLKSFDNQTASVFLADNAGGFGKPLSVGITGPGKAVIAEDFNGNGKAELAVLTTDGAALLSVTGGSLEIRGFYFTGTTAAVPAGSNAVAFFGTGDYNRDGRPDLFVPGVGGLAVLISDGNGGFAGPRSFTFSVPSPNIPLQSLNPAAVRAADLNGDGISDLALLYGDKVVVMTGNGRGEFGAQVGYTAGSSPRALAFSDINRDGKTDLAVLNNGSGSVTILINDGKGVFTQTFTIATGANPRSFAVEDFTGDGIPDLIVKTGTSGLSLLAGDGKGGFAAVNSGLVPGFSDLVFRTGDFNGDGITDLVVLNAVPFTDCSTSGKQLVVLTGDGRGGFATAWQRTLAELSLDSVPSSLEFSDLNGDGRADLLFTSNCQRQFGLSVMLSGSDGSFSAPVKYAAGSSPVITAIGDFNGDARADVVVTDTDSTPGSISILTGKGDGSFNSPVKLPYPFGNGLVAAGDFNEDGTTDLALAHYGLDTVAILPSQSLCAPAGSLTASSAASYARYKLSSESIASVFGSGLATETQIATSQPLPDKLAGVSVKVTDRLGAERLAPLFFVSPLQINYQIPSGTATGPALITVIRNGSVVSSGTSEITAISPGLFTADASGSGLAAALALRVKPDNSLVYEPVTQFKQAQNRFTAVPIDLGSASDQVFLVLFGTGLRHSSSLSAVKATIGGVEAEVTYAGSQNGFVGLDQINVRIPRSLAGRGEVEVGITADGKAANPVRVNIR